MNKLLPCSIVMCALLAACENSETVNTGVKSVATGTPEEQAISAYIKRTSGDPESYQPLRFSKPTPFSHADSANAAALVLFRSNIRTERNMGDTLVTRWGKDTANVIGKLVAHSFRLKNRMGALVLDSAYFVVYSNGQVGPLVR